MQQCTHDFVGSNLVQAAKTKRFGFVGGSMPAKCFHYSLSRLVSQFITARRIAGAAQAPLRRNRSSLTSSEDPAVHSPLIFQTWGTGTDVGKTIASTALLQRSLLDRNRYSLYVKPVQTGYPEQDDSRFVVSHCDSHPNLEAHTLYKFKEPASPDLAARKEARNVEDNEVLHRLDQAVASHMEKHSKNGFALVECAGGVLSPTASGSLQADCYRPFRMPAVLVGDSTLGGISATLAAYEGLLIRGYDVPAIIVFETEASLENVVSIEKHIDTTSCVIFSAPRLPPVDEPLAEYFTSTTVGRTFDSVLDYLLRWHAYRQVELREMRRKSSNVFWYPFTQHSKLEESSITVIDSAYGSNFATPDGLLRDAIGSWWTNGVGHGNAQLAKDIGAAAGRYGHVMFAKCTHAPVYNLAMQLLSTVGASWASRVFFSDDGSTAVEAALKMAFRKRRVDVPERSHLDLKVLSLVGAYHGDTLGAMNLAERSVYNARQSPWYEEKGFFLEPPTFSIVDGQWTLKLDDTLVSSMGSSFSDGGTVTFSDKGAIFGARSHHEGLYASFCEDFVESKLASESEDIGALVLEPVLQAAGGMKMIDPPFQRALVDVCRKHHIPVVIDEVFTGFYRLGVESASPLLGIQPDIACFAKLLTGGTVPLAVTLASESVYESFLGDTVGDALLHGHSYTAHPIGCAAALSALSIYRQHYNAKATSPANFWDEASAKEMSCIRGVKSVTVLGTVLAVRMDGETGYGGEGSREAVALMRENGIMCRELGSVFYVMCTPLETKTECERIQSILFKALEKLSVQTSMSAGDGV